MNHWSIEISKVDNGYLCETYGDNEEGTDIELTGVFVIEDEEKDEHVEHRTMQKLLWEVMQYFGVHASKHNKVNCRVRLEDENGKILD